MTPQVQAARFVASLLIGLGLGVFYCFLRPLRPKLTALSDRLAFAHQHHWQDVITATVPKFDHIFWLYYSALSRTEENEKYFRRMEASLTTALPHLLRAGNVSLHHKLYLVMIRIHPGLYRAFRRVLSKFRT